MNNEVIVKKIEKMRKKNVIRQIDISEKKWLIECIIICKIW